MADYDFTTGRYFDPDGGSLPAINIIAPGSLTFPSVTLAGGTIFVWANKVITLTIGGTSIPLTVYNSVGGWTLYHATSVTASGAVVITSTEANTAFCDFRCFAGSISDEAMIYYYNDVIENGGKIVLP